MTAWALSRRALLLVHVNVVVGAGAGESEGPGVENEGETSSVTMRERLSGLVDDAMRECVYTQIGNWAPWSSSTVLVLSILSR